MRSMTCPIVAFLASLTLPALNATGDDTKSDLRGLEGTWEVVSIEVSGKKVDVGKGSPDKVVIKGGKITIWANGEAFGPFKERNLDLDPKKKPKTFDVLIGAQGKVPGIYELKENELKLAIPKAPDNPSKTPVRPESFDTAGKPVIVLITKRIKD